jgi:hypothetical protein
MTHWIDADVVCPYYKASQPNRIRCEGVAARSNINLTFEDTKKQEEYMTGYCCDIRNYYKCLICETLNRKYGVNDEI